MLESTSFFEVKKIVFDDGDFAIAKGLCLNDNTKRLAVRWYSDGIGFPNTFGKSQWFLLPEYFTEPLMSYYKKLKSDRDFDKLKEFVK